MALPIALGIVPARCELARRTLDDLEGLWNTRWSDGGHDRYHTSGQPDQPGPWPFATAFILRAEHDAGNFDRSRRALEWLNTCQGGRAGAVVRGDSFHARAEPQFAAWSAGHPARWRCLWCGITWG